VEASTDLQDEDFPHFDYQRHVYHPREVAQPRYVEVNPKQIEAWLLQMAQGQPPTCQANEWGALRPLMVRQLEHYARRDDPRGPTLLDRLQEYDRAWGT
jgi:hypothetical protein